MAEDHELVHSEQNLMEFREVIKQKAPEHLLTISEHKKRRQTDEIRMSSFWHPTLKRIQSTRKDYSGALGCKFRNWVQNENLGAFSGAWQQAEYASAMRERC